MVELTSMAQIALDTLGPEAARPVQRVLQQLEEDGVEPGSKRLNVPGEVYSIRAGELFQVVFAVDGEKKRVLDIVNQDRLDNFHRAMAAAVP